MKYSDALYFYNELGGAVMQELEKLYTIDDIARMTSLTSRTIRNYLKDGSLQGKKIGGQWRFTMNDINRLFNSNKFEMEIKDESKRQIIDFMDGVNTDMTGEVQICTIADVYCEQDKGKLLSKEMTSYITDQHPESEYAKFDYEYIAKESKARFTLFGSPQFVIKLLKILE